MRSIKPFWMTTVFFLWSPGGWRAVDNKGILQPRLYFLENLSCVLPGARRYQYPHTRTHLSVSGGCKTHTCLKGPKHVYFVALPLRLFPCCCRPPSLRCANWRSRIQQYVPRLLDGAGDHALLWKHHLLAICFSFFWGFVWNMFFCYNPRTPCLHVFLICPLPVYDQVWCVSSPTACVWVEHSRDWKEAKGGVLGNPW